MLMVSIKHSTSIVAKAHLYSRKKQAKRTTANDFLSAYLASCFLPLASCIYFVNFI